MQQYNKPYPLNFCKYEEIEEKMPKHVGSSQLLDDAYINIWYVSENDAYYATVEIL